MRTRRELFVDNFAGGGGASNGIEVAIGRSVDIAINHDPAAIAMHKANHPDTKHYCEDVREVDPIEACAGQPVALAWFSPDCKHFSRAKGGKPVDNNIRGLAWVSIKWALTVRPRVIMLENVPEIQTWAPWDEITNLSSPELVRHSMAILPSCLTDFPRAIRHLLSAVMRWELTSTVRMQIPCREVWDIRSSIRK